MGQVGTRGRGGSLVRVRARVVKVQVSSQGGKGEGLMVLAASLAESGEGKVLKVVFFLADLYLLPLLLLCSEEKGTEGIATIASLLLA